MRSKVHRWFTLVLILGSVLTLSPKVRGESCSCSAPDGSCSATVSCSGGCYAMCENNGGCIAACSGLESVDTGIAAPRLDSDHSVLIFTGGTDLLFHPTSFSSRFHEITPFDRFWKFLFVGTDDKAVANAIFCAASKQNL